MRTAKTVVDEQGTIQRLGLLSYDIPGPRNHDALSLEVTTEWLTKQRCPEHGLAYTHLRAHWAPHPTLLLADRPAVMFRCPQGHNWEVVITHPGEGKYV